MTVSEYIEKINSRFKTGITTEHSFRGDLQTLIEGLVPGVMATNEPTHIACGAPDYIITKKNIPLGYIEAKDIDDDLESKNHREQFDRYRKSLDNLIITDYLNFQFYKEGVLVTSIRIAQTDGKKIIPVTGKFDEFTSLIRNFCTQRGQTIKSSKKLAEMMADKARVLANVIEGALTSDEENEANSSLKEHMLGFKNILIHDITAKEFSDIYAQTIAYGMFAGRLHDHTLETFTRQEASELIPKSNPFLRKLFGYIAGPDIDERILWIVDALADIFRATDVAELLKNFGKSTQQNDPIIHFYETFLAEYDPKLRKARGVWYTPEPVVNFIVRAVDDILKTEFNLPDGLADRSKTKVKVDVQGKKVEQEVHKVQILDPATGTGTFLAEVIKQVYKKHQGQQGAWSGYVEEHLVPRLNGFELLMASYAMAHLKLDLLLTETGYNPKKQQRLRVFLTNSLEEYHPDTGSLFANWLSSEANEANHIKRDTPVMVILGNPPYSGESSNKGDWILNLMEDYKKEPGGKEKLKERNPKWINDDYVKFLRYGQHFIEKNGEGVLAFINPHGFLDNPTFRGMRWNLLKTYDKIYTIDLHGNSKKKETSPDGSVDVNVFDIMQGVSINLFIKTGKKKTTELGEVFHFDLYGKREAKYDFLWNNNFRNVEYNNVNNVAPNYFFVPKDFDLQKKYDRGFAINDIFNLNSLGIQTHRDSFAIAFNKKTLKQRVIDFYDSKITDAELIVKYQLKETNDWRLAKKRKGIFEEKLITRIDYRFFDTRYIYLNKNIVDRDRKNVMQHLLKDNLALTTSNQQSSSDFRHIFVSPNIQESCLISLQTKEGGSTFPLYLYPENDEQKTLYDTHERVPNLNAEIIEKIGKGIGLKFVPEKEKSKSTFSPIDILDYIYAVLHSPSYREKYKAFLKIDFPRVPYPKDVDRFWQVVKYGSELRQTHLLETPAVNKPCTSFPEDGTNVIDKVKFEDNKVWINEHQYFDKVPQTAWDFYIGGYAPAQKWLKDRKDQTLSFDDIIHYQKIIVALTETSRLMKEIDKIKIE